MLELTKILRDIDSLGRERADTISGLHAELAKADAVISRIGEDLDTARARIATAKTSWLTASFDEPPDKVYDLPVMSPSHAVVAVDGSQITPDKNEVTLCFLLNVASITLYYGTGNRPSARSVPKLCFRDEDLYEVYNGQRVQITDKLLGMRRTLTESAELEYAIHMASKAEVPVVALWDGSLIRWSLANEPADYKKKVLDEYLRLFDLARDLRVPIAGYVSDPGSRDFINSMKIMLCEHETVDCDKCTDDVKPCDAIGRLKDTFIFNKRLAGGKRSVLFTSGSKILKDYREHNVRAFYLDTGRETARIEVPEWVANDPELINLTHAVCCDQAQKGRGYPVALAEAHEHAVVRGPERAAFYEMIERSFIKHGAPISRSMKRISKNY